MDQFRAKVQVDRNGQTDLNVGNSEVMHQGHGSQQGATFPTGDNFGFYKWGRKGATGSGQRPLMLLTILCTRQPSQQRTTQSKMSMMPRIEKPCSTLFALWVTNEETDLRIAVP